MKKIEYIFLAFIVISWIGCSIKINRISEMAEEIKKETIFNNELKIENSSTKYLKWLEVDSFDVSVELMESKCDFSD